ncbi:MAG: methyltransferase domain-containing protein, partial [Synechococcaceae cyanobacterium]
MELLAPEQFLTCAHRWDIINFSHSLEHIVNPIPVLERAIAHLNPGGLLLIDAPSVDSLSLRVWGPFWQGLEAPRHLSIPAPNQVVRLLQRQRLRLRRRFTYGSAALFQPTLQQAARGGDRGRQRLRRRVDRCPGPAFPRCEGAAQQPQPLLNQDVCLDPDTLGSLLDLAARQPCLLYKRRRSGQGGLRGPGQGGPRAADGAGGGRAGGGR